jgi:hypothetical protein
MWLVLCTATDIAALTVARGLVTRGLQPLEIISAEELACNLRFEHRLTTGACSVHITLADGRVINSAAVRGTLNRLHAIPYAHLRTANATDRQYAEQELFALYLSWLNALPGVMLNRPSPQGLCGDWRHPAEWAWLANRSGLATARYQQSEAHNPVTFYPIETRTTRTLIVVNGACYGAEAPQRVADGCSRLAELSETPLLGCDFSLSPSGDWIFSNASPLPDLRKGGASLQTAIADALRP